MSSGTAWSGASGSRTRILYRTPWYWYGTTYRWNDAQTDATLVPPDGESEELTIRNGDGLAKLVWSYPSRRECLSCHNSKSRGALGFYTAQLNRPIDYGDGTENQLEALSHAGYLDREITDPHTYPALAPLDDGNKSLEFRAVSYIEANCANCHRPHLTGIAQALFDARTETPVSFSHLIGTKPHNDFGDGRRRFIHPGEPDLSVVYNRMATPGLHRMPPLASSLPDDAAVDLMAEWIRSVGGNHFAGNATADADGDGHTNYTEFLLGTDAGDAGDKTVPFVRISRNAQRNRVRAPGQPRCHRLRLRLAWQRRLASGRGRAIRSLLEQPTDYPRSRGPWPTTLLPRRDSRAVINGRAAATSSACG